jgi:four helix bundle protein
VRQEAHALARCAAAISDRLPRRAWSLADQLRRASGSVPFNIADGNGAPTRPDYLKFLGSARKSLNEVDSQIALLRDLDLASSAELRALSLHVTRTGRLLSALTNSLSRPAVDRPAVDRPAVRHPPPRTPRRTSSD